MKEGNKPSLTETILAALLDSAILFYNILPKPLETKYAWARRLRHMDPGSYYHSVWSLKQRGLIKVVERNGKKFIDLTKDGQLRALLIKAKLHQKQAWDHKWRLILFDIPEKARDKRNLFRKLLKVNNFIQLQASVYISPWALNKGAVTYLKESGLIEYIRILRVDVMDDDKYLLKKFKLS